MAKNSKLKISKKALKNLILEMSVDVGGNKVSDRILWGSEEFMDITGLCRVNPYTEEKEGCSLGTVSYYKKLLKLSAEEVFQYHQLVTGKINPLADFDTWNLKTNVKSVEDNVVSDKVKKTKLIKDFGLKDGKLYNSYTLRELEEAVIEICNVMGLDGKAELKEYYKGGK